jgi:hypothetical protein
MRKKTIWNRLSLAFHIGFWVTALVWLRIAGEAGSPLPDNWRRLLFWAHMTEWGALFALSASIVCAVISRRQESRIPVSGILSLALLIISAYFWITLLRSTDF